MRDLKNEPKKYQKKYRRQRVEFCIADCDVWEFDDTICHVMIRGLSQLEKYVHGYPPGEIKSLAEWKKTLRKMRLAFEIHLKEFDLVKLSDGDAKAKWDGLQLFVKYLGALWD